MSLGAAAETSSWLSGVRHRALIPLWTSSVGEIVWAYWLLVRRCSPFSCVVLSSFFLILLVLTLASLALAFRRGSGCRRSCHGVGLSSSPSFLVVLVATRGELDFKEIHQLQKRLVIAVGLDVGIMHHPGDFSGKGVVRIDQSGNEGSERLIKF